MTPWQATVKRGFDLVVSGIGLLTIGWLIVLLYIVASVDTRKSGFFIQERVGRFGRSFRVIKLRTMRDDSGVNTTVTTAADPRVTRLGRFLRHYKLDELPQLLNVFVGDMSFVGPRPDVKGFDDELEGEDRLILSVRPGITGPATLHFRDEEQMLQECEAPEAYNREVIFPEKVQMNLKYVREYRLFDDLKIIWQTLFVPR